MANYASGVNPIVLRWAREKAGYSLEEIARSFNKDVEEIRQWETGGAVPTYNQLEKLAYSLYKRPVALFFFPEPPQEPDPGQSFRTLPDFELENLHPDTRFALREAQSMQMTLSELGNGLNPSEKKIFRDIQFEIRSGPIAASRLLRSYLGVRLETQAQWRNTDEALKNWREVVQDVGIFIFKRFFHQEDISGFCLIDDEFPVIYLNNDTPKTRQIFTLFHELAHILLSTSGITKLDDRYLNNLTRESKNIEIFCNQFTAEFLVPADDFAMRIPFNAPIDRIVAELSRYYKVSREVILRKLLDRGSIDQGYYEARVAEWISDYQRMKKRRGGGGDYYATQATYLGDKFLGLAFSKYYEGGCTLEQLADYLNIKAKSVARLEQYMLSKSSI